MHVSEFLDAFPFGEDVEVVVTPLPELLSFFLELLRSLALEDAESGIESPDLRLADEEVDVFGHQDVAVDVEAVLLAAGFQDFFETDAGGVVVKEGEAAITAEGDEMKMALMLVALQTGRHRVIVEGLPGVGRVDFRGMTAHSCAMKLAHEWGTRRC